MWKRGIFIIDDAEDARSEEFGNFVCHPCESAHEEINGFFAECIEGGAGSDASVDPRVEVVQHVDEDDTKRPDIRGLCRI